MEATGRRRAAVLVIHGVGEQPPLATLGLFSQGLIDHLGLKRPQPGFRECDGQLLPVLTFAAAAEGPQVEVLEFSWQHLVRGRSSVARTLGFYLETMLAPLDFRRHWRVLAAAGTGHAPGPWLLVLRQLLTALLLLLPLLLAAGLLGAGIVDVAAFLGSLRPEPLPLHWQSLVLPAAGVITLLLAVLQLAATLADALEAARLRRRSRRLHGSSWSGLHGGASRLWRAPALVTGLLLVTVSAGLLAVSRPEWLILSDWLEQAVNRQFLTGLPLLAGGLLLGGFFLGWLRDYAGDVAWYVDSDRRPEAAVSRHDIRKQAAALVTTLLRDPEVERVIIAGHSLGSVIGFDALNVLSREQRAGALLPLGKLAGFVTFGSPLDKVAYFFREHTPDGSAVHAQLLSFLHPTGRLPSRRDDGPYRLADYTVPLRDLPWVNIHAPLDPISDPLVFYRVTQHVRVGWWLPDAHVRYWRDPRLYEAVAELVGSG